MSPTVLRVKGFRFYFFSREEMRPHVHVQQRLAEAQKLVTGEEALQPFAPSRLKR